MSSRSSAPSAAGVIGAAAGAAIAVVVAASFRCKQRQAELGSKADDSDGRIGLVGTGWALNVQLPQFRKAGLHVTAICSRSAERAQQLAAEHGIAHGYGSMEELLRCNEVDMVSIVTPPYLHCDQLIAALEAGKHVIIDKPMARNAAEAERMSAAARRFPTQISMVDHELRFTRAFQRARAIVRSGAIGSVACVTCAVLLPSTMFAHAIKSNGWQIDASMGGGILGAIGSHVIDAVRFLLDAEFEAVSAEMQTMASSLCDAAKHVAFTADDYASLNCRIVAMDAAKSSPQWSNKAPHIPAHIVVGAVGSPATSANGISIVGTLGTVAIDTTNTGLTHTDAKGKVIEHFAEGGNIAINGTLAMGRVLRAALRHSTPPEERKGVLADAASIEDGLATVYVMDAARASAQQNAAWVTVATPKDSLSKRQ